MGEVTQITLPQPPALSPVEGGLASRGRAYTVHVPANATGPVAVQATTGELLLCAATEHYYRDAAGEWDVIYGAFPAEPLVSGCQARYEGPYPITDEVVRLEPQRVKQISVLYERPRQPGSHLGAGVEFGISWLMSGVTLPVGRHEEIKAGPFTLPRPWVADATGERIYGSYEVVETEDGSQQLFAWFDAAWLLSAERVYPVTVDPTVVVNTTWEVDGLLQLPDGTLIALVVDDVTGDYYQEYLHAYINPGGNSEWQLASTPMGSGRLPGDCYQKWSVDSDGRIYWAYQDGGPRAIDEAQNPTGTLKLAVLGVNGYSITYLDTYTVQSGTMEDFPVTLAEVGGQGQSKTLHLAYGRADRGSSDAYLYAYYLPFTVSTSGTLTAGAKTTLISAIHAGSSFDDIEALVSVNDAGTVRILVKADYQDYSTANPVEWARVYTTSGSQVGTLPADTYHDALNGFAYCGWYYAASNERRVTWDTGNRVLLPASSSGGDVELVRRRDTGALVVVDAGNDGVSTVTQIQEVDPYTGTVLDTASVPITQYDCTAPAEVNNGVIPIIYTSQSAYPQTIYSDVVSLNAAPYAPSNLTLPPFDATKPATARWTFSDSDVGDSQSTYQLQIRLSGAASDLVDTGEVQSPLSEHTLPADTLPNGNTYQWRVRVADQSGQWSPWSAYAIVQTDVEPVVTILRPAAGSVINASMVTVEWSVPSQGTATVRLYDEAGVTVLQTVEVTSASTRMVTVTGLQNHTEYQVSVQATNSAGVVGAEAFSGVFSIAYVGPRPPMDVVAAGDAAIAAVKLRWRRGFSRLGTFARPSVAYLPDGTEVASGQTRYYDGIMVEEGTTNIAAPATTKTGYWHLQGYSWEEVTTFDVAAGETITFSADLNPGTLTFAGRWLSYSDNGVGLNPAIDPSMPRQVHTHTFSVAQTVTLYVVSASTDRDFMYRNFQIERKAFATSFAASSRVDEMLAVPLTGVTTAAFCIRQWVNISASSRRANGSEYPTVLYVRNSDLVVALWLYHDWNTPNWRLRTRSSSSGYTDTALIPDGLTPDGMHLFEVKGKISRAEVWLDGALVGYIDNPLLPSSFGDTMYIGSTVVSNDHLNATFGQTQILNYYPTDAESLAAYQQGVNGLTWTDKTIALYDWHDSLEGGTQESFFSHWGVERGENGAWTRIALVDNPAEGDATYDDYAVGSGREYDYRVVAYGSNGTETKGETVQAALTIDGGIWLHDPRDPANTTRHFLYHELPSRHQPEIPSGKFLFAGRKSVVVQMDGSQMDELLHYRLFLSDESGDYDALWALFNRRTTLCLRNHRGRKAYVNFTKMPTDFDRRFSWADVEFQVVAYDEEV